MMGKLSKEVYIGEKRRLGLLDWRKKNAFVEIYKMSNKQAYSWLSCPLNGHFGFISQGELVTLNDKFQRSISFKLSSNEAYKTYDWGRSGLSVVTFNSATDTAKLARFKGQTQRE